ncbi:MAG TPA: DUF1080 domain-containing protein [Gemmataceae bacterium]|jgi:hypothetical protein|nr:DUF1080 domain-containing protein [Gemmataceae bacterium]
MRRLIAILLVVTAPAFAEDKPKPNTLTPKEIADGWILLFDGETTFGWKTEGDTKVERGLLIAGGEKETVLRSNTHFGDLSVRIDFKIGEDTGSMLLMSIGKQQSTLDAKKAKEFSAMITRDGQVEIRVKAGMKARFQTISCVLPEKDSPFPTDTVSLFNGKDLTGWKLYDAARAKAADPKMKETAVKSQYTVTKEGWLNVKNGPGDLQTEGQWADFVVQLECISNGKHLNSGLFFRAIPDLYQQGYEAQIRNEWVGDDRTKPVDFGTGAIYRRQAARKVVSTDGEWFTMTVAAHGKHFATWVNGCQVVDWTDDRKESDNARQGFKKGKGALSIQGHDATTDLSFRNIRIQSLDK